MRDDDAVIGAVAFGDVGIHVIGDEPGEVLCPQRAGQVHLIEIIAIAIVVSKDDDVRLAGLGHGVAGYQGQGIDLFGSEIGIGMDDHQVEVKRAVASDGGEVRYKRLPVEDVLWVRECGLLQGLQAVGAVHDGVLLL